MATITNIDVKNYTELFDYNSDGRMIYRGWAHPGSDDQQDEAVWIIQKFFYKSTQMGTQVSAVVWADGNKNPDNIWDDRASLTYS